MTVHHIDPFPIMNRSPRSTRVVGSDRDNLPSVGNTRGVLACLALVLLLTTCSDDKPFECMKPAECVGRPGGSECKQVAGKGRCVQSCKPPAAGQTDNCPLTTKCDGKADDGSNFCEY
jgi:hypothetical protein